MIKYQTCTNVEGDIKQTNIDVEPAYLVAAMVTRQFKCISELPTPVELSNFKLGSKVL